jgi:hypothetical protein
VIELPPALTAVRDHHPWAKVAERARQILGDRLPELLDVTDGLPQAVFGLGSGFFYLPAAQAIAWGLAEAAWIDDFLVLLAVGHCHFAAQDLQLDEGRCPPELCLISDVALLEYLDELRRLAPVAEPNRYTVLHDHYYRWYVQALSVELSHRRQLRAYTANEVVGLGLKAAPGNTVLHVVADATGRAEADLLVRSVMQLCAGLQIVDDLNDLERDYQDRNFTMPLTSTLLRLGVEHQDDHGIDAGELPLLAASLEVTSTCLQIAGRCFHMANKSASDAAATVVGDLANTWLERVTTRGADLRDVLDADED